MIVEVVLVQHKIMEKQDKVKLLKKRQSSKQMQKKSQNIQNKEPITVNKIKLKNQRITQQFELMLTHQK